MKTLRRFLLAFSVSVLNICLFLLGFPCQAFCQDFPSSLINFYIGVSPGGTGDPICRAMAEGAEKLLGVSVVGENKGGGMSSVCAALLARKKPDGYTIGKIYTPALTTLPHLMKLSYDPLKDFSYIMQFSKSPGGICVRNDSPIKTIDEFIEYAKKHPNMSYGTAGIYSPGHLAMELFAKRFGLQFRHIPYRGGGEAATALIGGHLDFAMGSGIHTRYVKQGVQRILVVCNVDKRDPNFPNIPTFKDIGCEDAPGLGWILVGPKGMPGAISKKLEETFKKVAEGPVFQKIMVNLDQPYDYRDRTQLEKDIPAEYEWMKNFLKGIGAKKEE